MGRGVRAWCTPRRVSCQLMHCQGWRPTKQVRTSGIPHGISDSRRSGAAGHLVLDADPHHFTGAVEQSLWQLMYVQMRAGQSDRRRCRTPGWFDGD
jgi:hypothetical protein